MHKLPNNIRTHVLKWALSQFTSSSGPRTYLEIGCMFGLQEGASTLLLAEEARRRGGGDSRVYSIDADKDHIDSAIHLLEEQQEGLSNQVEFLHGFSHKTLPSLLERGLTFDLVWLDGGAHPEICMRELELILPQLSSDGLILIDDCHWLEPSALYTHSRDLGKGHLIVPYFLLGSYLMERETIFASVADPLSKRSTLIDSLASAWQPLEQLRGLQTRLFTSEENGIFIISRRQIEIPPFRPSVIRLLIDRLRSRFRESKEARKP